MSKNGTAEKNKIDCLHCVYFAVTWEPHMPKSCKLFGFKTALMPSQTVFNSTGEQCLGFKRRETKKPE